MNDMHFGPCVIGLNSLTLSPCRRGRDASRYAYLPFPRDFGTEIFTELTLSITTHALSLVIFRIPRNHKNTIPALISLRSMRFRASSSRKLKRDHKQKECRGRRRAEKETLARKPHYFEKLRSPTNAAFDWCGAGSVD